jgi:hypothetical protein
VTANALSIPTFNFVTSFGHCELRFEKVGQAHLQIVRAHLGGGSRCAQKCYEQCAPFLRVFSETPPNERRFSRVVLWKISINLGSAVIDLCQRTSTHAFKNAMLHNIFRGVCGPLIRAKDRFAGSMTFRMMFRAKRRPAVKVSAAGSPVASASTAA